MTELWASAVVDTVYKSALKCSSSLRLPYRVARLVQKRLAFHVPFWPFFFWLRRFGVTPNFRSTGYESCASARASGQENWCDYDKQETTP